MRDTVLMYLHTRERDTAEITVVIGSGDDAQEYDVTVEDNEPDDVWGPILQRALEAAGHRHFGAVPAWRQIGWEDVTTNHPETVLLVTYEEVE